VKSPWATHQLCRNDRIRRFQNNRSWSNHYSESREKGKAKRASKDLGSLKALKSSLIPSREGFRRLHRRRGVCTSRTDLMLSIKAGVGGCRLVAGKSKGTGPSLDGSPLAEENYSCKLSVTICKPKNKKSSKNGSSFRRYASRFLVLRPGSRYAEIVSTSRSYDPLYA